MLQEKCFKLIRDIFEMNYPGVHYQVTFDTNDKCYYVDILGRILTIYDPVDFTPITYFHPNNKKHVVIMDKLDCDYSIYEPFDNFIPNINIVVRSCNTDNQLRNVVRFKDLKPVSVSGCTYVEC